MTVYVEYVLIDNLVIDYLLLKATFSLTAIKVGKGRLLFCAFFGAMVALLYPLLESHALLSVLLKVLSGFFIVLLAHPFNSVRSYFINVAVFFAYTFITGGAITGVYSLLNIDYSTETSIAFMIIPVYLVIKGLRSVATYLYRRKDVACLTVECGVFFGGNEIKLNGFYDTGNGVYDGDSPVIFCEKHTFMQVVKERLAVIKLKKINVDTVNQTSENFCVKLEKIEIYNNGQKNIYNNVTLCLVKGCVGDGYDLILHPALMESNYENKFDKKAKKIS
ncbi:MAG: sigma-E processing peptidase SpoIIGA [Clostridia bacterium]|nr:sigma-E processing peptidase SpoIIGA [Clostridia bacterium]